MQKCKSNQVKFNGCLTLILSVAVKITMAKLLGSNNQNYFNKIGYQSAISNRGIFDINDGSFSELGVFITQFLYAFKNEDFDIEDVTVNAAEFYADKFWQLCRKENSKMHSQIQSNIFIDLDYGLLMKSGKFFSHFLFSNVGLIQTEPNQIHATERIWKYSSTLYVSV